MKQLHEMTAQPTQTDPGSPSRDSRQTEMERE